MILSNLDLCYLTSKMYLFACCNRMCSGWKETCDKSDKTAIIRPDIDHKMTIAETMADGGGGMVEFYCLVWCHTCYCITLHCPCIVCMTVM